MWKMRNADGDDDVLDQHARVDFMVLCLWTTVRMWDVGQSDTLSWLWSNPSRVMLFWLRSNPSCGMLFWLWSNPSCGMLIWLRSNPSCGMLAWLPFNPSCGMLFCFYSCELQYSMFFFSFFYIFLVSVFFCVCNFLFLELI